MATSTIIPAPIVVSPSQYWEGNDGPWSTFTIQVGTPAQNLRVLVSTAGSATWVVLPEGCPSSAIANCADLRGKIFQSNSSSTWNFNDYYDLALESNLGYDGTGAYGFDKIGIGWQGDGGPILEHQVVTGIATEDFWLGNFGLTPRPTNFTDFNDPRPSFVQTLRNRSLIPSLSWSYTAGAPYRLNKIFGSLIFGGYDVSKAGSSNLTLEFAADISRDLTVGLQAITMKRGSESIDLLPTGIFTFIDSTIPHIWLPVESCKLFETSLGITWDPSTNLYLLNDTVHDRLLRQNASFTFKIGNNTSGSPTIDINLPYASFDLTVDYPIVQNRTRYFPVVRAANDTQYTLGRTFLQEAYLTVDYDRSQFYLSQARFDPGAKQLIQAILPPNSTNVPSNSTSRTTLSIGAIAGTAIGSLLALVTLIAALWYCLRRRRLRSEDKHNQDVLAANQTGTTDVFPKAELDASEMVKTGLEMEGRAVEFYQPIKEGEVELPDSEVGSPVVSDLGAIGAREEIHEMVGDEPRRVELPAK